MKNCFAFLDSRRLTSQPIQQLVIRDYAKSVDLNINFVGAEIQGNEHSHRLFCSYIRQRKSERFIFFTIYQFMGDRRLFDIEIIREALFAGIELYFATEKISLKGHEDLEKSMIELLVSEMHQFIGIEKVRSGIVDF